MIEIGISRYISALLLLIPLFVFPGAAVDDSNAETLCVRGLKGQVEVWRDAHFVPHIRAENEDDLFLAFGYITAADRLFQLDGSRRYALGTLSEVFGEARLPIDQANRDIGFGRLGEEMLPNLSEETRRKLSRYTEGINAYIETHRGKFSFEFKLLGYEPEPWQESHSLALLRMFSWWLSSDRQGEMLRTHIAQYYNKDIAYAMLPPVPQGSLANISTLNVNSGTEPKDTVSAKPPDSRPEVNGSNCWVVGPAKTRDGYPILASDPHLELFAPSTWYQVHLVSPGINVIGVTFPGVPIIAIGHNRRVAWGVSNLPFDVQDYTTLKVSSLHPGKYLWGDEWLDFVVQEEPIRVGKGEKGEVRNYRRLLSEAGFVMYTGTDYTALRWTGSTPNDDLTPLFDLMYLGSALDLRDALADFNCSPQSFTAADIDGHIVQVLAGEIPVRGKYDGLVSASGSEKPEWDSFIGTMDFPYEVDPLAGYLAHANNLPDVCYGLGCGDFKVPYSYKRISELIETGTPVDVDYICRMQMDVVNPFAKGYVEYILRAGACAEKPSGNLSLALSLLGDWDYDEIEDSSGATLFHEWFIIFTGKLFEGIISPATYELYQNYTHAIDLVVQPLLKGESNPLLFPNVTPEGLRKLALDCLEAAVDTLDRRYGNGPEQWQWGKVHHTNFKHPSGVEFMLGAGDYPDRGSRYTIKVADFFNEERYESTFGVSYRQVVEMRPDDIRGWWVLPPGNHGSSLSPHYRDQVEMWLKGEYFPMYFYEKDVKDNCKLAVILTPKGAE